MNCRTNWDDATELNAMGSEEWEVVGVAPRDWVSSSNTSGGHA
jgi:hypothetical protein